MDEFKQEMTKNCGVGGLNCECCNEWFGKDKPQLNRKARAQFKVKTDKLINEQIDESKED